MVFHKIVACGIFNRALDEIAIASFHDVFLTLLKFTVGFLMKHLIMS